MANSYLERTPSGAGSRRKWTISFWVKRSRLGVQTPLISTVQSSPANTYDEMYFNTSDKFQFSTVYNNSQKAIRTSRVFRDINAWYHIVFSYDTDNSTDTDHAQLWINGERETSFEDTTLLASGANGWDSSWNNSGNPMRIGYQSTNTASYFEGYMSHIAFVNDAVVAPTVFGETDSTSGIWKFKSPSGVTWGTNGFHLKMENSGALGTDSSGNTNTFTVNGNLKQALDTPSNVHATWNVLDSHYFWGAAESSWCTNGNTTARSGNSQYSSCTATLGASSGKYYWEFKYVAKSGAQNLWHLGIKSTQDTATTTALGVNSTDYAYKAYNGQSMSDNSSSAYGSTYAVGDIIGVAMDLDNNKLYFSKNGTWQNSGVPTSGSTGTGAISIAAASTTEFGVYVPAFSWNDGSSYGTNSVNFGNGYFGTTAISSAGSNGNGSLFEYDVPSGYYALNTKNINTYG